MTNLFSLVPRWAWAALAGLALIVGMLWAHSRYVDGLVEAAVLAEGSRWQGEHREALARAQTDRLKSETQAAMAALEVHLELKNAQAALAAVRADLRVERGRLRDTIAEFRDRAQRDAEGSPAGSVAHGAVAAADALDQCSGRYEEVAGVADSLAVQVTGLQAYITQVVWPLCISGEPPDETPASRH